ncbi:MAG: 23S rRNA (adenine(2030)-N(6))-methyltransferase RlmJ [Xanthomonadaceae bacterium]|jgi:23S rRNA (adenine2030-N6)-methyltransferase|nr:23S rRNA (adenine(2030)-N(6))-methyltransferase RlmJ [Xanthomonadaceae bacterium]
MNYRHAYHAGNHADVLKHTILLAILDALKRKETAFFVLDTHAGRGRYLLSSQESQKTGESSGGILRLLGEPDLPLPITRYLHAVASDNPVGSVLVYPGSPLLIAQAMRDQDRLTACELHPEEAAELKTLFSRDQRVAVHFRDGYEAIKALLPPRIDSIRYHRGLVLIDPPYEAQEAEFPRIFTVLADIQTRWPQAHCALWYPIKQRRNLRPFFRKIASSPIKSALIIELLIRPDDSPLRLNGSGMLILNPPWQFDAAIAPALPVFKRMLGEYGASTRLEWIKRES